ncbi:hypothetical protein EWK04_26890 [Salmonella enterica subsp. enterica serovar Java]|uniref:Uncharacterized protein n=1 Tax=Salmonella enterica subsp. enterica serovar Java TaxID=224729 RepID=A0A3Y9C7G1_SALEB|nr:hypothetical protein [Salmonella enterica subsp. enterica serovar Java]ECG3202287.1 hypothetical protein [Salmonella enterica subsp. enterica serovar Java]EDC4058242.1 hypothetical protein [Salmonella enterica subsp. enterica serovar Java]HCA3584895.1 hypothetical protein [Salmonella enterica subsp. enterica serovar Java]
MNDKKNDNSYDSIPATRHNELMGKLMEELTGKSVPSQEHPSQTTDTNKSVEPVLQAEPVKPAKRGDIDNTLSGQHAYDGMSDADSVPAFREIIMPTEMKKIGAEEKPDSHKHYLRGGETEYLRDIDFKWLNGRANERSIFWFWVYIRNTPEIIDYSGMDELNPPRSAHPSFFYMNLKLPQNTTSTDERSKIIITYFKSLSFHFPPVQVKELFNCIRDIWLNLNSQIKKISWIKRNDSEAIEWAWDYLSKRKDIEGNITLWFKCADLNEKYIATMGVIDCWGIFEDTVNSNKEKMISQKNLFLKRMENAFRQRERRSRNAGDDISRQSQKKLQILAKIQGKKINQLLEKLIDDEYQLYELHPEDYKALNKTKK